MQWHNVFEGNLSARGGTSFTHTLHFGKTEPAGGQTGHVWDVSSNFTKDVLDSLIYINIHST